jgi:dGTPase
MPELNYETILIPTRRRTSSGSRSSNIEEFSSDRSRIVFSSSFRRLQQKAQVFSLESNSFVRTRLTHSLEVADVGRNLALKITEELAKNKHISSTSQQEILLVVENACYLHDFGNPPFGHFGEEAIREWSKDNLEGYAKKAGVDSEKIASRLNDFYEFDGNPQGLRMVTRLHCENCDPYGLNISYPTLLSCIKYTRTTGEPEDKALNKKPAYFQSELPLVMQMYDSFGISRSTRYPLSYIMEAADDISYCLSDISDGIEKKILSAEDFVKALHKEWIKTHPQIKDIKVARKYVFVEDELLLPKGVIKYYNREIAIQISKYVISKAAEAYLNKEEEIFNGTCTGLIDPKSEAGKLLDAIKKIARNKLYRSSEAENIEISGYAVIRGLLNCYSRLISLPRTKFDLLMAGKGARQHLDYEWRLLNRISQRLKTAYKQQLDEFDNSDETEWWLRIHMIVDYISGMTDDFALKIFQMLEGISIQTK